MSIPLIFYLLSLRFIPAILFLLIFFPKYHSKWRGFFSFKLWAPLVSTIVLFSLGMWQFNHRQNYDTSLLGFRWQWSAIATYGSLFILQFALLRRKLERVDAFALSWFLVLLASILYELPWHFIFFKLNFTYNAKFIISLLGVIIIFRRYGFQWKTENLGVAMIPLIINWLIFFSLPKNCYWWPRLSVFPLLLFLSGSPIKQPSSAQNEERGQNQVA